MTHTRQISVLPGWEVTSALPSNPRDGSISLIVAPLRILTPLLRDDRSGPALLPYGPPERTAQAFLLGARDYVSTPFAAQELLARADRIDHYGSLDASTLGSVVEIAGESVVLTGIQREIFDLLARHAGGVVDREAIQAKCGGVTETPEGSRRVDMAMCRLRRVLRDYPVRIETVRGRGYRLVNR
ncbi:MAG: winged helix-turn-helix domain-containing protein [Alkalispirochaeta sp.]